MIQSKVEVKTPRLDAMGTFDIGCINCGGSLCAASRAVEALLDGVARFALPDEEVGFNGCHAVGTRCGI